MTSNNDTVKSINLLLNAEQPIDIDDTYLSKKVDFRIETSDEIRSRQLSSNAKKHFHTITSQEVSRVFGNSTPNKTAKLKSFFNVQHKLLTSKELKLKIFIVCLFVLMILGITLIYVYQTRNNLMISLGNRIEFNEKSRVLFIENTRKQTLITGHLGVNIDKNHLPFDCSNEQSKSTSRCFLWNKNAQIEIDYNKINDSSIQCYKIKWKSLQKGSFLKDCYQFGTTHWYGGGGLLNQQQWPLKELNFSDQPYLLKMSSKTNNQYGPILQPYWLTSNGVAIHTSYTQPLFVSMNNTLPNGLQDQQVCISSGSRTSNQFSSLEYEVCVGSDIRQVHLYVLKKFNSQAFRNQNTKFSFSSFWSLPKNVSRQINQQRILEYLEKIKPYNILKGSTLILPSVWQGYAGNFEFNKTLFPNITYFLSQVESSGINISLSVSPYISVKSRNYFETSDNSLLLQDGGALAPSLVKLNRDLFSYTKDYAGVLDVTNASLSWLNLKFKNIQTKYRIQKFYFLGGEVNLLPYFFKSRENLSSPNEYTHYYNSLSTDFNIKTTAFSSQSSNSLVAIPSCSSQWDINGLSGVIPKVLTTGILGYPFVLQCSVGGDFNEKTMFNSTLRELYSRWLQLAIFLPVLHLSVTPNSFTPSLDSIFNRLLQIRFHVVVPHLKKALVNTPLLHPFIRPLWWISPNDTQLFTISDQFLIGDDLMTAPILISGTSTRKVYIPQGNWVDMNGKLIVGPSWETYTSFIKDSPIYFVKNPISSTDISN